MTEQSRPPRPRWRQWAWFAGLYLAGLAAMFFVTGALRALIPG